MMKFVLLLTVGMIAASPADLLTLSKDPFQKHAVRGCGFTVVENTYWQTPVSFNPSCSLTIRSNSNLLVQSKRISQIRLDFLSFSIGQPNAESVCATDSFRVTGTTDPIPIICGDNSGQHMYLNVPHSSSDVGSYDASGISGEGGYSDELFDGSTAPEINLTFNFGELYAAMRMWNIRITMIAAGSSSLAPVGCLQYFTSFAGTVRSFNWRDVAGNATRQLANQDYGICFRTVKKVTNLNLLVKQQARKICFTPCTVTTTQLPFSLSVPISKDYNDNNGTFLAGVHKMGVSQILPDNCNNDYLIIAGGYDKFGSLDRFCGEMFTTLFDSTESSTVCTTVSPFRIVYRTNGDETVTMTTDVYGFGNRGFCLNYLQNVI